MCSHFSHNTILILLKKYFEVQSYFYIYLEIEWNWNIKPFLSYVW